ncbi:alpha/beta hydrolase [bacterium]|nr:MAG: alpha/beta hydrolase [bacterium]
MKINLRLWILPLCLFAQLLLLKSAALADVQKDVVYGEAGGQKLQLDVYGADAKAKKPAIIFVHGGGWVAGGRGDMGGWATAFAQKGYVCFSTSYRLVKDGKNGFPAQIDDVQRAVRWIRANANRYGVNPKRIGSFGLSAGGHLVALLGTTDTRDNSNRELSKYSSRVQCVVDLYGPTDFTGAPDPTMADASSGKQFVEGFLGKLPENAAKYRDASPVLHVDKKSAPFLIFHGAKDSLVSIGQSVILDEILLKQGIESKLIVFPNSGHAYGEPEAIKQTFDSSLAFFDRHLKN